MTPTLLVALAAGLAQDPAVALTAPPPEVVHTVVTEIEFIAQDVTTTADGPTGTAVLVRSRPVGFASMIAFQLDFDAKLRASTGQIH